MTFIAHANGFRQQSQPIQISVRDKRLRLTARPSLVHWAGDPVTFTPSFSDGSTPNPFWWQWFPDTLPNLMAQQDGGDCSHTAPTCTKPIRQSGTMKVWVWAGNIKRAASARISVDPCPPPFRDSILADSALKAAFKDLLTRSGPNLPPGDGIASGDSIGNKRERSGWIFKRPDGSMYFFEDTIAYKKATECTEKPGDPYVQGAHSGDTPLGHVHVHPTHFHDTVYGCPPDKQGHLRRRGPWDTSRHSSTRGVDASEGGGSEGDWNTADKNEIPEYVINADGEVWKLPNGTPQAQRNTNTLMVKYSGNNKPACNW